MLPLAQLPEPLPELRLESAIQGEQLQIGSQELQSTWRWEGRRDQPPQKLWLPLDLLEVPRSLPGPPGGSPQVRDARCLVEPRISKILTKS